MLLLPVRAEFADRIFAGTKTIELRRRPPRVAAGDLLLIYVPAPLRCIAGVATVADLVAARTGTLWRAVRTDCEISYREFRQYFLGLSVGYALHLVRPQRLATPVPLRVLRQIKPRFSPQGYKYLSRAEVSVVLRLSLGVAPHCALESS